MRVRFLKVGANFLPNWVLHCEEGCPHVVGVDLLPELWDRLVSIIRVNRLVNVPAGNSKIRNGFCPPFGVLFDFRGFI